MSARLEGRVAAITGAASGIGKATAQVFASEGATIVVNDLRLEAAQATVDTLEGDSHLAIAADVSDPVAMAAMFAAIGDKYGKLDVLVNNAGVERLPGDGMDQVLAGEGLQVELMEPQAFTKMLAIHVEGTFLGVRGAVPLMRNAEGGSIINMSSIAGLGGWGSVSYAAAKGAILSMGRSLCRELGPLGIRINTICPGVITTPMTEVLADEMLAPLVMMTPLGRKGEAEEIATTALYLASDDSSFVTGQSISPNGGFFVA